MDRTLLLFFLLYFSSLSPRVSAQVPTVCIVDGSLTFSQDIGTTNCTAGQNTTLCLLQATSNAYTVTGNFLQAQITALTNALNGIVASSCNATYLGAFGSGFSGGGTPTQIVFTENPTVLPAWSVAPTAGLTPPLLLLDPMPSSIYVDIPVSGMYQISLSLDLYPPTYGVTAWLFDYYIQMNVNEVLVVDFFHLYLNDGTAQGNYGSASATIIYPFLAGDYFFFEISDLSKYNGVATFSDPWLWRARLDVLLIRS